MDRFRQTEVENFHGAVGRDLEVGWLQISMNDALFVSGLQGVGDLAGIVERLLQRQRALRSVTLHQFHHQVVRPHIVERADVGMVERRDGAGFAVEAFGELSGGDFDGHATAKTSVMGFPDFAHPALPEL